MRIQLYDIYNLADVSRGIDDFSVKGWSYYYCEYDVDAYDPIVDFEVFAYTIKVWRGEDEVWDIEKCKAVLADKPNPENPNAGVAARALDLINLLLNYTSFNTKGEKTRVASFSINA